MTYTCLAPSNDLTELLSPAHSLDIIDFGMSARYRDYHAMQKKALFSELNRINAPQCVSVHLLENYNKTNSYIKISGPANVYFFHWQSGEPKIICTREDKIITEDQHWFPLYPFIVPTSQMDSTSGACCHLSVDFQDELYSRIQIPEPDNLEVSYIFPSHNNHFGHFLLDDFPGLWFFLSQQIGCIKDASLLPYAWRHGIIDLISSTSSLYCKIPAYADSIISSSASQVFKVNRLVSTYIPNPSLKSFLLNLAVSSIQSNLFQENHEEANRYLLIRAGEYSTRIANFQAVLSLLVDTYRFQVIDPSGLCAQRLVYVLSGAELVVAEAGSTTVVASIFSPSKCQIISLLPARMLMSPTKNMLLSGLPYHLIRPERTRIVLGDTVKEAPIQSSDIVNYSISVLKETIEDALQPSSNKGGWQ